MLTICNVYSIRIYTISIIKSNRYIKLNCNTLYNNTLYNNKKNSITIRTYNKIQLNTKKIYLHSDFKLKSEYM